MAYLNDQVIEEIRSSANIVDVISDYLSVSKKGKNYVAVCPFHDDHSPSLVISPERQIFNCFTCQTGGNVFTFIMKYENVSFIEAVSIVAKKIGYNLNIDTNFNTVAKKNKNELEIIEFAKKFYFNNIFTESGKDAIEYLKNRGITEEIIKEFNIGYADNLNNLSKVLLQKKYDEQTISNLGLINKYDLNIYDTFSNRIMIPIENMEGDCVGFTGRIFHGEKDTSKYMNTRETEIFKKGSILFNYHNARQYIRDEKSIIIVEGNMDAIKMSASGIKNVVALMGVALSGIQVKAIKKLKVDVILMLDNDNAGLDATIKNADILVSNGINPLIVRLSGAKDPDEYVEKYGVDKLKENIKYPQKYMDFKLEYLKNGKNLDNMEDLVTYVKEVISSLNNEDDLTKSIIISKISKDYQIDATMLKNMLEKPINKKVVVEEKKETKNERLDRYSKAVDLIIYYMLIDSKYIAIFQKKLGYFKEKIERIVSSEIVYYNNLHKRINIADFTSYIIDNNEAYEFILNIIGKYNDKELSDEEFNSCIDVVEKILKEDEIKKLKEEIKQENDINKKVELMQKLTDMKKEV